MSNEDKWLPDKSKFKDERGAYITQSLFLEVGYDTEKAVYTFADQDKVYKGVTYKSLRKLYLQTADPTEYEFAVKYLHGWEHWQRITGNAMLMEKIQSWREELEVLLRSIAIRSLLLQGVDSYSAARWAADGLWKNARKPTTKQAKAAERATRTAALDAANTDADRIAQFIQPRKP